MMNMMKSLTQLLLLLALLVPAVAQAYDFEVGGIYYDINGNEATVAQSPDFSYSGHVVIPSTVTYGGQTYTVTAIGYRAFYYCSGLTGVTMPNTITEIGERAFNVCESLTEVTIPNSVVTIGPRAFYYCPSMTQATIGNSVTTIGDYAFGFCEALAQVNMSNSVTSIGSYAFYANAITSIAIPSSVTTVGALAFEGCNRLERVDITNMGAWCNIDFDGINANPVYHAKHLYLNGNEVTTVMVPRGAITIKPFVFYGCLSINTVMINSTVTSIGMMAFTECRNLTSVSIPNSVTTIGSYAFSECVSLKSVQIPQSVTSIGSAVFDGTRDMTKMVVVSGNPTYDSRNSCNAIIETATNTLIEGCNNTVIPNTVTRIGQLAFSYRYNLTSLTIPNSVTSIGSQAFIGCEALTSIHIPASVVDIAVAPFEYCANLSSITVASNNPTYDSRNGCNAIIETATNKLIAGCKATVIPNTVNIIDRYAFADCETLKEMTIPGSVTVIGELAFENCKGLESLHIPGSVTYIGNGAFSDCLVLNDVYCDIADPTAVEMGNYVFSGFGEEYGVYYGRTLHVPVGTVEAYQADSKWSEFFEFIVENVPMGDVDGDGMVGIGDVTNLIDMVLSGDVTVADCPVADVDGDGIIGIADVTNLIDQIIRGTH